MSDLYTLDNYQYPDDLNPPGGKQSKVLMHSCCAPCASELMLAMKAADIDFTIFFYNPNIHPSEEYEIRKEENIRYADELDILFIDADYDSQNWFDRTRGQEWEPERGARCTNCFDMRFEKTAAYARANGFPVITSSLGISRWKDMQQINQCGINAAEPYDNIEYWTFNWRKKGGAQRMVEISKEEQFYQQEYCGCVYSLRDTNAWREKNDRDPVAIGVKFYGLDDI